MSPIVVYVPLTMQNVAKYRTWSSCATVSNILLFGMNISEPRQQSRDRHQLAAESLDETDVQISGSAHGARDHDEKSAGEKAVGEPGGDCDDDSGDSIGWYGE